ncbi:hypothetical protein PsyrCH409_23730 [Pseudomonas viridiflava]|nr:hypothetical protein PsyrCH409_23730 [Pseudomonas viridiflava]
MHGPVQLNRHPCQLPPNQRQDSAFTHVAFCSVLTIALQKHISGAASPDSQMICV